MARLSDGQREIRDEANRDARDFEESETMEEMRLDEEREMEEIEEGGPLVVVCTRAYRRKHGQEPTGRFFWTFRYGGERLWFSKRGEYSECRAEAIRRAAARGCSKLTVSSQVFGQDEGR